MCSSSSKNLLSFAIAQITKQKQCTCICCEYEYNCRCYIKKCYNPVHVFCKKGAKVKNLDYNQVVLHYIGSREKKKLRRGIARCRNEVAFPPTWPRSGGKQRANVAQVGVELNIRRCRNFDRPPLSQSIQWHDTTTIVEQPSWLSSRTS